MVQRLKEFGIENNYFQYKNLFEVSDKTCCDNGVEYIDFDETKKIVVKETSQDNRASCDALLINDSFNFIEFKSFKNVMKYGNKESFLEEIQDSLENKIGDSLWIFDSIPRHKNFILTKQEKKVYKNIEKNYYIVVDVDINPIENLAFTLSSLALGRTNIYDDLISVTSKIVGDITTFSVNKPQLIECKTLKQIRE